MSFLFANILLFVAAAAAQVSVGGVPGSSQAQGGSAAISGDIAARNLNNVRKCDQFAGANAGARLVACIADLPAAGGTVDARGLEGNQTISADIFSGVTKPVRLELGAATYNVSASVTVPSNVSIQGSPGQTIIKKGKGIAAGFKVVGTNVEIRGLRFEPQSVPGQPNTDIKLENASADIKIVGNSFHAPIARVSHYSAIAAAADSGSGGSPYATPVRAVLIGDNTFEGYARPVYLHSVENVTISRNFFKDTIFDAIRLRENVGYTIITENQFDNIGDPSWPDGQTRDALDAFASGDTLIVANNIVRKTAHIGFDIKGVDTAGTNLTQRVIVTGNIIRETRYIGINVYGDTNYDGAGTPLHTRFVDVSHNQVYEANQQNSAGAGDEADGGIVINVPTKLTRVTDNTVAFCYGRGIYVAAGADSTEQNKNIIVTGNIAVNNGQSASSTVIGINVQGVDGLVFTGNVAINDSALSNPYQATGITITSTALASPVSHTQIINNNIARGNTVNQIVMETNNNRATGVASFMNNVQEGTGAIHRPTWQSQRGLFFGSGAAPGAGDGEFRRGDIIFNDTPSATGHLGLINTATGAPGTWMRFGMLPSISADNGNSGATLTVGKSAKTQRWNTALTADHTVALSKTGAQNGDTFRIVREAGATGTFHLYVGSGPLKALSEAGQWCEVEFDGTAWRLTASGSL